MLGLGKGKEIASEVEEVERHSRKKVRIIAKCVYRGRPLSLSLSLSLSPGISPHSTRLKMMAFFATISKIHHSQDTSLRQQCRPISSRARIDDDDDIATWATFADMGRAGDTWVPSSLSSLSFSARRAKENILTSTVGQGPQPLPRHGSSNMNLIQYLRINSLSALEDEKYSSPGPFSARYKNTSSLLCSLNAVHEVIGLRRKLHSLSQRRIAHTPD